MSFGGGGGGGGDDVLDFQKKQAKQQNKYNKRVYEFNWGGSVDDPTGQQWRQYNFQVEGLGIQKQKDREQKEYQEETARQNWEFGKSQVDYQFNEAQRAYNKSTQIYQDTLGLNQIGLERAYAREDRILEEQFIDSAFQNTNLLQDLYEQTGTAGFESTGKLLQLWDTEGQADYQTASKLTELNQIIEGSQFDTATKNLEFLDQQGSTDYQKAATAQDLYTKEAVNRIEQAGINISLKQRRTQEELENAVIMREQEGQRAEAAFGIEQRYVESLQAQGDAAATQSGRSQGKATVAVLSAMGRNNAYVIDTLVRGREKADAQLKANKITTLNATQEAALASQRLDVSSLDNIAKADMALTEADRQLAIGGKGNTLDLDRIKAAVAHGAESTGLDVKEIARNLKGKQTLTGLDLEKIDWDLDNTATRFKTNQKILAASLDSAIQESLMSKGDKLVAKIGADLQASASKMLRPDKQPYAPEPLDLPDLVYQDPLEPEAPPEPLELAAMEAGGGQSFGGLGNILGGVQAGLGVASSILEMGGSGGFATAAGITTSLGSMLFS